MLKISLRLPTHKHPILIRNDETRTTELTESHRKIPPIRNPTIDNPDLIQLEHRIELICHPFGIHADSYELDRVVETTALGPAIHLCRAGAASASPAVVEVDHGRFAAS